MLALLTEHRSANYEDEYQDYRAVYYFTPHTSYCLPSLFRRTPSRAGVGEIHLRAKSFLLGLFSRSRFYSLFKEFLFCYIDRHRRDRTRPGIFRSVFPNQGPLFLELAIFGLRSFQFHVHAAVRAFDPESRRDL